MIELLKELILDFMEYEFPASIPRQVEITPVQGKPTICMGVRRSGKSTYLFQQMQHLLGQGITRQNILYLNFFDDRLHNLQHDSLSLIVEAYFTLFPEKKQTETIYCFFD